ncbi:CD63 antigen [Halyomorpha halys]|uniref:CD63 antigen n=1 Tax=Halyomorpha halys TaxID=286706 RepID=UPI0006D4E136|nr:CD63 antigen-like [Halyomorpha halys]
MKLKLKKLINFPHVGMGGRRKIFLLLAALCTCEGFLGVALIVLAAKPLSTVTQHLQGLDLLFLNILKAQIFYGLFVTFISVIGIRVTSNCIYSYNLFAIKRAQIVWSLIALVLIIITIIASVFLYRVRSLGAIEVVKTFERGMSQYLLDRDWKMRFDRMHQDLRCCGVSDHEDWFKTRWIPISALKPTAFTTEFMTVDGRLKKPTLPSSCCSPYYDIPCLHDFLQQESMSHQKDLSLFLQGVYTSGCIGILLEPILTSITSFSVIAILICIFQTCELIIANVLYYLCTLQEDD